MTNAGLSAPTTVTEARGLYGNGGEGNPQPMFRGGGRVTRVGYVRRSRRLKWGRERGRVVRHNLATI